MPQSAAIRSILLLILLFCSTAARALEVEISLSPDPRSKATLIGTTNLPDDTNLLITVSRQDIGYFAQAQTKVSKRTFSFGPFTVNGNSLPPGWYNLRIDSPIALLQSKSVQSVIGNQGQYMTGKFVKPWVDGGNVVELVGSFESVADRSKPNGTKPIGAPETKQVETTSQDPKCVKSSAGGDWVDCDTGQPAPAPTPRKSINLEKANQCLQGVRAAYEAYTMVVYDAKNPPIQALSKALDFRLSQQPFPASEDHAMKSLGYLTKKLRDAGVRAYQDWQVSLVAEEYTKNECNK